MKKIPERYRENYLKEQTVLVKNRVRLFCLLTVAIYSFSTFMWVIVYPGVSSVLEMVVGSLLAAGGGIVLYFNSRARTIRIAKINAYLFTALLLVLLVKLGVTYRDDALVSSAVFVFTLFFVSVIIPWTPEEGALIGGMHLAAYTANFMIVKFLMESGGVAFPWQGYLKGFVFLFMAFLLCLVIRKKETTRDIMNFVLLKKVESKNEQTHRELEWATRIHKTIIPASIDTHKADIAVSYLPIYYIGGDYVKFDFVDEDKMIFIISDVTGHGLPAALLVSRVHAEFERSVKEGKPPGLLLKDLDKFIKKEFGGAHMYLSAFCGLVDFKSMKLLYSNYGHPPQYIYRAEKNHVQSLSSQTSLLGLPMDDNNIYQSDIEIDAGDKMLLFTDGITETVNNRGEEYGGERLEVFLKKNHDLPANKFNRKLLDELDRYKHIGFEDDMSILGIKIKGQLPVSDILSSR
ncbi:PP2C family protein-serine/threonine phosphatase [Candidatus Omnitrophota bacterium]